jgi:hypothetical protein
MKNSRPVHQRVAREIRSSGAGLSHAPGVSDPL